MAIKTVEAQLVLGGKDGGATAAVNALVKSFEQAEKAGAGVTKSTAQVAKTLLEVEKAQAAVNTVMGARNGAATAAENLQRVNKAAAETKAALDKARAAKAAFDGQKPAKGSDLAKSMTDAAKALTLAERNQKAMTREVANATHAHERQAKALRDAERAAAAANVPLNALEQHQRSLAGLYDRATEAMRRQIRVEGEAARAAQHHAKEQAEAARHMRRHGVVGAAAGAASGALSIHGVTEVGREAWKAGAEVQANRANMAKAGIQQAERDHIADRSLELAAKYKNVTQGSIMELWKEMRSVMTDPHEVNEVIDPMVRAKSLLDANDKTGTASHGLNLLVKGAEAIGAAKDPVRFTKLLDSYVKAMQVMGNTVTPEGIYEMQKYSKTSGGRWSDRFIMTTAQSLGQELGGSTAGNSIDVATRQIVGGMQNLHSKAKEFARVGLIDRENLDILKNGEVKGTKAGVKHAVKGDDLAASDLDLWVYHVLLPALEKHNIKSEKDQMAWVQKNFTGTGANAVSKLIQQRESFEAHARMYGDATGLKGVDLNRSDPNAGLQGVTKSLETFLGVVSSPMMAGAAHTLDDVATAIGGWSLKLEAWNKAHPDIAKWEAPAALGVGAAGAGTMSVLAYKALSGGFGLKGSAVALDHSALALEAAAVKLGATGGLPGLPGAASKVPAFVGLGLGSLPTALAGAAIVAGTATANELPKVAAEKGATGVDYATGGAMEANPMDGLGPERPWLRDWWAKKFGTVPKEAGKNAGEKAGDGIKDGIKEKTPETVEQAQSLYDKIKDVFKNPIYIPMSFEGGGFGGGGAGIQKASFSTGGDASGSYGGGSGYAGGGGSGVGRIVRGRGFGGGGGDGLKGGSAFEGARTANQLEAYKAARAAGLSDLAARVLVANVSGESIDNPADHHWDGKHTAEGIFQHDPWRAGAIAKHFGKRLRDMSVTEQINAGLWEMRTNPQYRRSWEALQNGTDPGAMLRTIIGNHERPQDIGAAWRHRMKLFNRFSPSDVADAGGLRVKGGLDGQAFGGGDTHGGVVELAKLLQGGGGVERFTGFNDHFHAGTGSRHARGLAMDVTGNAAKILANARAVMEVAGLVEGKDFKVINEYAQRSKRWTGGHVHFEFGSKDAADRFSDAYGKRLGGREIPPEPSEAARGGQNRMGEHVDNLGRHIDRLGDIQLRSHHTVEVQPGAGLKAKTRHMRIHSDGPVRGNVGVSMPQTEVG